MADYSPANSNEKRARGDLGAFLGGDAHNIHASGVKARAVARQAQADGPRCAPGPSITVVVILVMIRTMMVRGRVVRCRLTVVV